MSDASMSFQGVNVEGRAGKLFIAKTIEVIIDETGYAVQGSRFLAESI